MIETLHIDIETFSSADLKSSGVYKYVESPDFEILLFGYSICGGPARVIDLTCGEKIPAEVISAIVDKRVIKWAFNAQFERICLSRWLMDQGEPFDGKYLSPESWKCTLVWSAYAGLPLSLESAGKALGLPEQKLVEGKELVKYFCCPCKPTQANRQRTRNRQQHDPGRWEQFKAYNQRDVEVEVAIQKKLAGVPVPESVWDDYHLDQKINDRGVALDLGLVSQAIAMDDCSRKELEAKMKALTGLENPNSVSQLRKWLSEHGVETESLDKTTVEGLLKSAQPDVSKVLSLRQQLAKSSVRKYKAMDDVVCSDRRVRGMFQFYGTHTGRWAGRLVQLQNLPQNHLGDIAEVRNHVMSGDFEAVKAGYDNIQDVLSQLIRTAFVPGEGKNFIVADFSAIEARVLAWLADEVWRQEVFARNGDIYCASASQMFKVPVEKNGSNSHLRQKGKIAELALGYGGGVGALTAMGAVNMGLMEDELPGLVKAWRSANPNIVQFWSDVNEAALGVVKYGCQSNIHGIHFDYQDDYLAIGLLSGRQLYYREPSIGQDRFDRECLTYYGIGTTKKWESLETYGAKLVENIVQATARDILCHAMRTMNDYDIVMHVHDEVVIEAEPGVTEEVICEKMAIAPDWAGGLNLNAEGYITTFYKKN